MGRVKRKAAAAAQEARAAADLAPLACALCHRPLGARTEWHHLVPKSEGGRTTVPVHPICHRAIHAAATNRELAGPLADLDALRATPPLRRFLSWLTDKPADFHAPTRRPRQQ